jgi:hypothetical protein
MSSDHSAEGDDLWSFEQQLSDAVSAITERRVMIEQVKGMLMLIYGIDADGAFDLLRQQSQQHNVKLRVIAEQIRGDLLELCAADPPLRQRNATKVLLTAHHRIADVAARLTDGQSKVGTD